MKLKIITSLPEAKKAWNDISPDLSIYDNWDFRFAFYKHFNHPLHFYAWYDGEKLVGLLPLQYYENEDCYEYFSEDFMEDNRFFVKAGYEEHIQRFLAEIKEKVIIYDLTGEGEFIASLPLEDYKYILSLKNLKNFEEHLANSFTSKRRRQFLKLKKEMEKNKIEIISNDFRDIDSLFSLNIKRHKEESYLNEAPKRETLRELLKNFDVHFKTFKVNGKKEGVSYAILYKGTYVYLSVGSNIKDYSGLGAYIGMANFDYAISLGAKIFDAGLGDCGWKNLWHFDKIPQYEYENKL